VLLLHREPLEIEEEELIAYGAALLLGARHQRAVCRRPRVRGMQQPGEHGRLVGLLENGLELAHRPRHPLGRGTTVHVDRAAVALAERRRPRQRFLEIQIEPRIR
jgi:hypothetical protein